MSKEGVGWNQIKKAYHLAGLLNLDAEELLEERAQGKGWGEILQHSAASIRLHLP